MKRVDVKLGFSCNNRCVFCVQGDKRSRYGDKSTAQIKDIIEKASKGHEEIVFTGGEPTIRDDLGELVSHARELGFEKIQIQTNGRRFAYKEYCLNLIEKGANEFAVAIQGPTPEIHNELTKTKEAFSQTLKGLRNLVELAPFVATNTVITKKNYKKLPELAELLVSLGVNQYQFAFIHISTELRENPDLLREVVVKKSEAVSYVKEGLEVGIEAGIPVMTEAIPYCLLEGYEDYVAEERIPDGAVYDADFTMESYQDYRKENGKTKREECKKCKYFEKCEGPWKEYPEEFGWEEFKPITE